MTADDGHTNSEKVITPLEKARVAAGLTQAQVAAKSGAPLVLVQRAENGLKIFKDTAKKIAKVFNVPPEQLFDYITPAPDSRIQIVKGKGAKAAADPEAAVAEQTTPPAPTDKPADTTKPEKEAA